jgi:sugar lactone lactonase YvrE
MLAPDGSAHASAADGGTVSAFPADGGRLSSGKPAAHPDQTPPLLANGIAIDEQGYLWIADQLGSQILRLEPPGMTIVARYGEEQGVVNPDDLVTDRDFVYWTGFFTGEVGKLDRQSGQSRELANIGPGSNPIVRAPSGMLIVGRTYLDTGLFEVDPEGNAPPQVLVADSSSINAFALAPDGFVYGPTFDSVIKIDLTSGMTTTLRAGVGILTALRYNAHDDHLYAFGVGGSGSAVLFRLTLGGQELETFATLSELDVLLTSADNFAIAADGSFYATRNERPVITRVSADGKSSEDFAIGR